MNTKTKEGARNKGNPYFLRVPWNKGGLVNTGPGLKIAITHLILIPGLQKKIGWRDTKPPIHALNIK